MEKSNVLMLEGFTYKKYPEWEKVQYEKFDVGFFTFGRLNGYGKKYILEPIFQNNKKIGGYERITIGYFKDDLLNGIGVKIEDNEILEYGFYENDRLIDIDFIMHDLPKVVLDEFYFEGINQGESVYYGENANNRKATGRGVVIDRKERKIIANFVDGEIVPGLFILINKGKVSYGFISYDEVSKNIADVLMNNNYRPPFEKENKPKNCFGTFGEDDEYMEGYFDENGLLQGLGLKKDGRESGIFVDDQLVFGSIDEDYSGDDPNIFTSKKQMLFSKNIKTKKIKYKDGLFVGEVNEKDEPNGLGLYFRKSDNYRVLLDFYKKREAQSLLTGNSRDIPEQIKNGDICYIATFKNGKVEGYCTRWIYRSINKTSLYYFWCYDEGIIAYKDRFKPEMSLYEYYLLRYPKKIISKNTYKDIFDINNKAYVAYFLKERIHIDIKDDLLLDDENVKYSIRENSDSEYELWIYLTSEQNENYRIFNAEYEANLKTRSYKKIKEKSYLHPGGLFELSLIDEGKNIRILIKKNFS